jgi:outer membrane protein
MKILTVSFCFLVASWSVLAGDMKVATVDLQRLVKEYYRAEAVAKQLEARHDALFKELQELKLGGEKLLKEAHDLQERSLDLVLNETARAQAKQGLELKLADFHEFEMSYDQANGQREAEFQNQAMLANKRIIGDVLDATRRAGETGGFNLVLNASRANPLGSDVLFTRNVDDLTELVLASLNATKPSADRSRGGSQSH